jgi:osmotically-inducible protein OsmY
MKTDMVLKGEVLDELEWEPSINATRIGVAVKDGVVTLSGEVESYHEKVEAERATLRVEGVKGVASEIEIHLPGTSHRSDADIARVALDTLQWNNSVPPGRIKVIVKKGWVTLEGDVDWGYQKTAAEDAVRRLMGVVGVSNQVAVKARPTSRGDQDADRAGVQAECRGRRQSHQRRGHRQHGDFAGYRALVVGEAGGRAGGLGVTRGVECSEPTSARRLSHRRRPAPL